MATTVTIKTEMLRVVCEDGTVGLFLKQTPVVRESTSTGDVTYERRATLTDRNGEPVSVISEGHFETIDGKRWKIHAAS